jgi:methionyl-tRNA formyltransferase
MAKQLFVYLIMRIALLCNDRIALPALDQLLAARLVVALGMPKAAHEINLLVQRKAAAAGVPVQLFTRTNFAAEIMEWLDRVQPDVVLVKTFPYRIPAEAIAKPKYGFINFHYAPLPEWRGSNPLFWMIRNQASIGGVSVHQMDEEFDTGPLLLHQPVPLSPDTNFGLLYTQLAYAGTYLTGILLNGLQNNTLQRVEQDSSKAKWYNRPTHSDLCINWQTMNAAEIKALVNACNPWNKGAATLFNGWTFGISDVTIEETTTDRLPGTILTMDKDHGFTIASLDGKKIKAEIIYCEEGFYRGHRLAEFGLQTGNQLSNFNV